MSGLPFVPRDLSARQVKKIKRYLFLERWAERGVCIVTVCMSIFELLVIHDIAAASGWFVAFGATLQVWEQSMIAFRQGWGGGAASILAVFSSPSRSPEELMLVVNNPPSWRQHRESLAMAVVDLETDEM